MKYSIVVLSLALAGGLAGCGGNDANKDAAAPQQGSPTKVASSETAATPTEPAMSAPTTPASAAPGKTQRGTAAPLICPVTGTKIASVKAAVGSSTYKGKTYYFCCSECKPKFDKDPQKIVDNAAKGHYQAM